MPGGVRGRVGVHGESAAMPRMGAQGGSPRPRDEDRHTPKAQRDRVLRAQARSSKRVVFRGAGAWRGVPQMGRQFRRVVRPGEADALVAGQRPCAHVESHARVLRGLAQTRIDDPFSSPLLPGAEPGGDHVEDHEAAEAVPASGTASAEERPESNRHGATQNLWLAKWIGSYLNVKMERLKKLASLSSRQQSIHANAQSGC
jgi:hypothetical protein